MGNPEHVAKLKQGVSEWNLWRRENPAIIPDLAKENFSKSEDFIAHLQGANFTEAQLEGANFRGAQLEGANFQGACLKRANFLRAHLKQADYQGADLEKADFQGADLEKADFQGADLKGADFLRAHLFKADFIRANLELASFQSASLQRADFRGARLEGANFWGADVKEADFRGARAEGANFQAAHLEGAYLQRAHLKGANSQGGHFKGAKLHSADFSDANLRFAMGIRFDETKILHASLDSQPGTFWQRWLPWFILNPLTDPWSTLRRTYTGANFAIALIALIALLLPFVIQATAWRGVNEAQSIMRNTVAALKPALEAELREFEARAAAVRERAGQVPFVDASEWFASPEWLLSAVTAVSELEPCLAAECRSFPVWQLLLGVHRGAALVILTLCVLLWGFVRGYVTTTVSAYRDEEERSGYAPAWAPEPREPEPSHRWLVARLPAFTQRLGKHAKVQRLRRALGGYEHLVWLHIFLRCFLLVVILAGIVNWSGVLPLPVEIPAR